MSWLAHLLTRQTCLFVSYHGKQCFYRKVIGDCEQLVCNLAALICDTLIKLQFELMQFFRLIANLEYGFGAYSVASIICFF